MSCGKNLFRGPGKEGMGVLSIICFLLISSAVIGLLAWASHIFSGHDLLFQIVAVVLSVVFTSIVTSALLSGQTNGEEKRDKNVKIYESKVAVFSQFVTSMWAMVNKNELGPEDIKGLRSEVFGKLIFYLEKDDVEKMKNIIGKFDWNSSDPSTFVEPFSKITYILKANLGNGKDDSDKTEPSSINNIGYLWNSFQGNVVDVDSNDSESSGIEIPAQAVVKEGSSFDAGVSAGDVIQGIEGCLHFNVLNKHWQYEIFNSTSAYYNDGTCALGLVEFGETWRTERIMNCKKDQIVFLYQSGGPGYVGAFLSKGWVVIKSEGNGAVSCVREKMFDREVEPVEVVNNDYLDRFCARSWIEDGYTRISFLIVEPIFFSEQGVGRISVYRPTISSYHPIYAWRTLARMAAVVDSGAAIGTYKLDEEIKTLSVNGDDFKEIIDKYNIRSSEWDSRSNSWIDK